MTSPRTLSEPARELLRHLSTHGTATSPELRAVQEARADNRSKQARASLPYNLRAMGYIDQVPDSHPPAWQLTAAGRAAVARDDQHLGPPPGIGAATTAPPPPPRLIEFAGRLVPVPASPRWVFDLSPASAG